MYSFAFSKHDMNKDFTKLFNFLVPKYKFHCLGVACVLFLLSKGVRNVNMSVCDTLITLIHV